MAQATATQNKTIMEVYDPAMCCSTGVCGPDVDDALVDFSNDVKWLKAQGIDIKRFNLGQEPEAFKTNMDVVARLKKEGTDCLPILLINGEIVAEGGYPTREQLLSMLDLNSSDDKIVNNASAQILSGLEQAALSGDEQVLREHFELGRQEGIDVQQLVNTIQKGLDSRQLATQKMVQVANELIGSSAGSCGCSPGGCC